MKLESQTLHIGILVYPGCLRSGAVVPPDVFAIANRLMQARPAAQRLHFQTHWLSARGQASVHVKGLDFQTDAFSAQACAALMLPGIDHQDADDLAGLLAGLGAEQALLTDYLDRGKLLAASCSSTCLLAHSGRLDGRRATTSWWLSAYFRQRYPQVLLEAEELIVQDRNLVSSGGVSSYFDLALWLVGHFGGAALRQMTAKVLVMDANRSSQVPYVAAAMLQNQGHMVVERARRWLNRRLEQDWSIDDLAAHCHVSQRTLLRRFREALNLSPLQYAQQLRVERAKGLLETTRLSLEEITERCGYDEPASFSKVFKQWVHITPKEYRSRFGLRL